ncbi:HSP70-17 [Scenedesmus sp. PABB004]|nr:HSP70-17 [Scenedesmus sp. PABB004]
MARSGGAPGCRLLLIGALLGAALLGASASLMAIDLGSEYLKVCLVKPGRTPISIVVNEMSRRRSPALVGLVEGGRVLGEEAFSLGVRYPGLIFSQLRNLLGRSAADAETARLLSEHRLPYKVVDDPRTGTAALQVNETHAYLVEELVAGLFHYAKQITDAQAGEPVVDAVVVVPAWFGVAQRTALIDAAALAGLNVLGLVNGHAAAALQYGIERDFSKKEQTVLLYDMGSGSTEAALVKYSTHGGRGGKGGTNQFEVLDVEWDHALGSAALDAALAEHFAAEFQEKGGGDVRPHPKAMAKLARQVRRTKEVLSANTAAPFSVEELLGGRDFQSSVTREAFEAMAQDFWARAAVRRAALRRPPAAGAPPDRRAAPPRAAQAPLTKLLERNGLKPGDVDAVELLGGGSRVPKLQAVLSEALGGRHLDRHLDADEALVLGAGLFAANLSSSFRLRKFGMTDVAAFGVTFESDDLFTPSAALPADAGAGAAKGAKAKAKGAAAEAAAGGEAGKPGHVLKNLLPAGKKLPIKRAVKYSNLTIDGFSFALAYNASTPHGLPPGVCDPALAAYTVAGITDAIERYNHSGVTTLRFEADLSGLLSFASAECVVELEVMEERVIEVPLPANDTDAGDAGGAKAGEAEAAKGEEAGDAKANEAEAAKSEEAGDAKGDKEEGAKGEEAGSAKADEAEGAAKADEAEGGEDKGEAAEGEAKGGAKGKAKGEAKPKVVLVKKTITVPRRKVYHVSLNVTGPGPRHAPLSGDALADATAHVAAWRAAEAVKAATAKAKNDLEAYIIATRERLETDEAVQQVTEEAARVSFVEALTAAEDWLYGDGEAEGGDAFRERLAALRAVGDPIARRAAELELRPKVLSAVRESAAAADALVAGWAEAKPWIGEEDTQAAADKIAEFRAWLAEQEAAQAGRGATEEPAFVAMDVVTRWEGVQKAVKKTDAKRKPKPPPAAKNETAAGDAAAGEEGEAAGGAGGAAEGEAGAGAGGAGEAGEAGEGGSAGAGGKAAEGSGPGAEAAAEDEELPVHEEL